jgi:8-oxo-dGTP pyrophosphatase MutT (NUDIX family)
MDKQDIHIKTTQGIFSYRVAGILIRDGKVLLQRTTTEPDYAVPGGHVNFGEASEQALIREYKEEIGADILPVRLLWIAEIFYPIKEGDCHQICLFYLIELCDETQISLEDPFYAFDALERNPTKLEFSWIKLSDLDHLIVSPSALGEKLTNISDQIEQFVFIENVPSDGNPRSVGKVDSSTSSFDP